MLQQLFDANVAGDVEQFGRQFLAALTAADQTVERMLRMLRMLRLLRLLVRIEGLRTVRRRRRRRPIWVVAAVRIEIAVLRFAGCRIEEAGTDRTAADVRMVRLWLRRPVRIVQLRMRRIAGRVVLVVVMVGVVVVVDEIELVAVRRLRTVRIVVRPLVRVVAVLAVFVAIAIDAIDIVLVFVIVIVVVLAIVVVLVVAVVFDVDVVVVVVAVVNAVVVGVQRRRMVVLVRFGGLLEQRFFCGLRRLWRPTVNGRIDGSLVQIVQ